MAADQRRALALASLLAAAGVTHFARPRLYDAIVPGWVPGPPRAWTYASGAAELAVAAAITYPGTRRRGGLAAAALFTAVFPANVQMAGDWRSRRAAQRVIAYGRLPLQAPLVWWALKVAAAADGAGPGGPGDPLAIRRCCGTRRPSHWGRRARLPPRLARAPMR